VTSSRDRIDLHAHTTHSDGTLRPADLMRLAAESGLRALAVTDHDTTSGWAEAREAGRSYGVELIPGAEITARFPSRAMHLLAYGFDDREPSLVEMLREIRGGRDARNPRIVARLVELGMSVTMDEVRAEAAGEVIGRPHIARVLVRRGYVPDTRAAFQRFLKDGGPAFFPAESVEPGEVIAGVRRAGGAVVVAHPRQLRLGSPAAYDALVKDLAAAGMAGVEVLHPSHDAEHRALFRRTAEAHGLVPSAGSDFHGANKPDVRLGVGDGTYVVEHGTWEALRARCAAQV
jgi:predicted metal-dependent phosphoesterase TrpH